MAGTGGREGRGHVGAHEGDTELQIERQLTLLLRRVQHMHLVTASDGVDLDRSGYGIMSRIADSGPSSE